MEPFRPRLFRLAPGLALLALAPGAARAQQPPSLPPVQQPPAVPTTPATGTPLGPAQEPVPGATPPGSTPLPPDTPTSAPRPAGTNLDATAPAQPPAPNPLDPRRPAAGLPGATPPPAGPKPVYVDNADEANNTGDLFVGRGNVRLRYEGYLITADRVTWNRRTNVSTLEGNVTLTSAEQVVYADFVQLNGATNEFFTREGRTIVPAARIGQGIAQPVRISGKTYERNGRNYRATDGLLTTCDFPNPHYKVGFRQADIIPNSRIVLRDAVVYRYDRPVLRIKYLVIPIREEIRYSFLPYVGRTEEEGYFAKSAVGYVLGSTLPGILRIDAMEKKGLGLGFDQAYRIGAAAAGTLLFYRLPDRTRRVTNTNGRLNHQQYIGDTLATIASDFQNNSYQSISPTSQTSLTNISVARNAGGHGTTANVSLNNSNTGTSRSGTTTYTLAQTERIGTAGSGNLTFRLNGSDNTTRTPSTTTGEDGNPVATEAIGGRREQNAELQLSNRFRYFDANLQSNRNLLLDLKGANASSGAFSGTQRLPDLTLTSNGDRLGGFLRGLPLNFQVGYGRFLESVADTGNTTGTGNGTRSVTTGRALFNVDAAPREIPLVPSRTLGLQLNGTFRQTVYREDSAQYVLNGRSALVQRFGPTSSLNLSYTYLRPYGAPPREFRLDDTGSNNNLASTLTVDTYRTKVSLITGYDIQRARAKPIANVPRAPWQNVALQLAFRPDDIVQTRFTAAYDINRGRLLDATNRIRIRTRQGFALDTGVRFDPATRKFPQITEVLTLPLFSRDLTLQVLSGYNGVTSRFDYKNFALTRSFHDYDLLFTYVDQPFGFRTERGFNFSIRLRALPTLRATPTGQFGTPLDTGTGEVF